MHNPTAIRRMWISTGVLLTAATAIFRHADDLSLWHDELWSIVHSTGSLRQIVGERDLVWPPGYYVLLHGWLRIAGRHDFVVHMLGALLGLLTVALVMRAGRALHSVAAGWLAGLALGTSGYAIYFMLEVRGYTLALVWIALTVILHARWLAKPTPARTVAYAIGQALIFYTRFPSGMLVPILLGLRVIIQSPRLIGRWTGVMLLTGVACLPLLPQVIEVYRVRASVIETTGLPAYFFHDAGYLFRAYSQHHDGLWSVVLLLGVGGWLIALRRQPDRTLIATLAGFGVWGLGVLVFAYLTRGTIGLYTTRYLVFTLPALMLLLGTGLSHLPRWGQWSAAGLLLIIATLPWQPFDHRPDYADAPPVRDVMRTLARRWQLGDTLVIDPPLGVGRDYAWWYYESVYFPRGPLPRAASGETAGPRVWFLSRRDRAVPISITAERIAVASFELRDLTLTLYEGPPQAADLPVGEGLWFQGAGILSGWLYRPEDTVHVATWWQVTATFPDDFALSVVIEDARGQPIAHQDSGPIGPLPPDRETGHGPGTLYRDDRRITLPDHLPMGYYSVRVIVYLWVDERQVAVAAPSGDADALRLGTIHVASFYD